MWRSGDANDRLCVAVDLASTLVHEATHCCGLYGFDLGRKPCPDSYTIGNNMKMALLLRYALAMEAGDCKRSYGTGGSHSVNVGEVFMIGQGLFIA